MATTKSLTNLDKMLTEAKKVEVFVSGIGYIPVSKAQVRARAKHNSAESALLDKVSFDFDGTTLILVP